MIDAPGLWEWGSGMRTVISRVASTILETKGEVGGHPGNAIVGFVVRSVVQS